MNRKRILIVMLATLLSGCDTNSEVFASSPIHSTNEIFSQSHIDFQEETVSESVQEVKYISFKENIKLYINPSVQYTNPYASNLGNEGQRMNEISHLLTDMLKKNTNIEVYANNQLPGLSLSKSVKESNQLQVDYHLALHSNAGGGQGSEGWYTQESYCFTQHILSSLQEVLPYPTRGLKNGATSLYELKASYATATLIEILFHDDYHQALFLTTHQEEIATAIYKGIIDYFKDTYDL